LIQLEAKKAEIYRNYRKIIC